ERLKKATNGINLTDEEYIIYLQEAGVREPEGDYNAYNNLNKKQVYSAALQMLNDVANDVTLMTNMKEDDITIDSFSDSIQARISQLEHQIRMLPAEGTSDSNTNNNRTFFLFQS